MSLEEVGTVAWLERTGGALTADERWYLLRGVFPMIRNGFALRRHAKASGKHDADLSAFEPPETPMVHAARAALADSPTAMANHSFRTAFWTLAVLSQHGEVTPRMLETTWVAALLHDVGLDRPPPSGDFSVAGVAVLEQLAHDHGWSDDQTHQAGEAIAVNLSTRVDPMRVGMIAWAMNAGGAAELGIWPHRAQLANHRIREIEARFPREGFRRIALGLIRDEVERVPDGRFALLEQVYWLLMR